MRSGIGNSPTDPLYVSQGTAAGVSAPAGTATDPSYSKAIGAGTIATGQVASSISPAAATQIVASRNGRESVTITNVTGTQDVYLTATGVTTGLTTGFMLAGIKGAAVTLSTSAAVFATSPTAAQTLSYIENY